MPFEETEWCDVWVECAAGASRPRVLLIGDSIARSYYGAVRTSLVDVFACARLATSKCVCDPLFEKELRPVIDAYDFAVIHVNNGLHGWAYDESTYAEGLSRVFDLLMAAGPDCRVVWGNSTPVWQEGGGGVLHPRTERVRERNRLAAALAAERRLPVNDLFGLVIDHPEYMSGDGVHFNAEGQAVLARQVEQAILGGAGCVRG